MSAPVTTLVRRYHFSASHRLHIAALSSERNREIYGKCNNPHGHGHNYAVEVAFRGPVDEATGMVLDLAALDAFAHQELLERFDQTNLNCLNEFNEVVPSTENLALALHGIFARFEDERFPQAHLDRVYVDETSNNSFEYAGGAEPAARHPHQERPTDVL